jgi:hypothetical protein
MNNLMSCVGAAFYGASISSQFKTKSIKVQDVAPYDVQVMYTAESKISSMFCLCFHEIQTCYRS